MKKNIIALLIFLSIIIISYIFRINFVYILVITTLCIISYYYINNYFTRNTEKDFIEKRLLIANKAIIKIPHLIILIVKNQKVVWGNDLSYSEFPILKTNRDVNAINVNYLNQRFEYNNQIYHYDVRDGVYFIENITAQENKIATLNNRQTNIAILSIDNYLYLEEQLSRNELASVLRDLRVDLLKFFDEYQIFYQEFDGEKYQLLIPSDILTILIKQEFKPLFDIIKKYQSEEYMISYSLGVSYNQKDIRTCGYKAIEALELARSRGGAQTIIFNGDKRTIFGGNASSLQGSTMMKARLIYQTTLNIIKNKEQIYLMGHKHPDNDCIGAIVLLAFLTTTKYQDKVINIVIEKNMHPLLTSLINGFETNIKLIDHVDIKNNDNNLLIILDTQSQQYISHPEILAIVSDIIIIDHHQAPDDAIVNVVTKWIEPSLSSAVEMIMQMYVISQAKLKNNKLKNYLLYGILTDTNDLLYRVTQTTLEMVKRLVAEGASMIHARQMRFDNFNDFHLIAQITSNVELINHFSFVYVEDIEDHILLSKIVNHILEIQECIAAVIISKVNDQYLVKMRSMGDINTKLFLEEFGGGGHLTQAACVINRDKCEMLYEKIKNYQIKES